MFGVLKPQQRKTNNHNSRKTRVFLTTIFCLIFCDDKARFKLLVTLFLSSFRSVPPDMYSAMIKFETNTKNYLDGGALHNIRQHHKTQSNTKQRNYGRNATRPFSYRRQFF